MKVEPIHHVPMLPGYNSPFSAGYAIEGGRLIFFSGCCTVPTYHKHPHDPDEERRACEKECFSLFYFCAPSAAAQYRPDVGTSINPKFAGSRA